MPGSSVDKGKAKAVPKSKIALASASPTTSSQAAPSSQPSASKAQAGTGAKLADPKSKNADFTFTSADGKQPDAAQL